MIEAINLIYLSLQILLNFIQLLKQTVFCIYMLVLLVNLSLRYNATPRHANSGVLKLDIRYKNFKFPGFL